MGGKNKIVQQQPAAKELRSSGYVGAPPLRGEHEVDLGWREKIDSAPHVAARRLEEAQQRSVWEVKGSRPQGWHGEEPEMDLLWQGQASASMRQELHQGAVAWEMAQPGHGQSLCRERQEDRQEPRQRQSPGQNFYHIEEGMSHGQGQQREDKQELLQRARAEGVLEAFQNEGDGQWYVELSANEWRLCEYPFWCRHCEASLNLSVMSMHLNGERHRKRLAQVAWHEHGGGQALWSEAVPPASQPQTTQISGSQWVASSSSSKCAAAPLARPPPQAGLGPLELWQEHGESGLRCKACWKMCDGVHEYTAEHNRRVETFLWELSAGSQDYPEPPQAWLAWVSDMSYGKGRYIKCLLCNKWVNDLDSMSTEGYVGSHGDLGEFNQKDHSRKLLNIQYYRDELAADKRQWHPTQPHCMSVNSAARAAEWMLPPSVAAAVPSRGYANACNGHTAAKGVAAPDRIVDPAGDLLPEGWKFAWDTGSRKHYYYKGTHVQWDRPTGAAPSLSQI